MYRVELSLFFFFSFAFVVFLLVLFGLPVLPYMVNNDEYI